MLIRKTLLTDLRFHRYLPALNDRARFISLKHQLIGRGFQFKHLPGLSNIVQLFDTHIGIEIGVVARECFREINERNLTRRRRVNLKSRTVRGLSGRRVLTNLITECFHQIARNVHRCFSGHFESAQIVGHLVAECNVEKAVLSNEHELAKIDEREQHDELEWLAFGLRTSQDHGQTSSQRRSTSTQGGRDIDNRTVQRSVDAQQRRSRRIIHRFHVISTLCNLKS